MLRYYTKKFKTPSKHVNAKIFSTLALLLGIANSSFITFFPIILYSKLSNASLTGIYYSLIAIIALLASILSTYIFRKFSKNLIIKISLLTAYIIILLMTFAENIFLLSSLDIIRTTCIIFIAISISLFLRDFSTQNNIAENEGSLYFHINIGWLIGPIIGGFAAKNFGNESIYLVSGFFYFLTFLVFLYQDNIIKNKNLAQKNNHIEGNKELIQVIKSYFKNKEFIKIFLISSGLNFWWAVSLVYIPINIIKMNYSQEIVGLIISGSIIPLILLEPFVGKHANKNGVKKYIFTGFFILSIITASYIFFKSIPIIVLILFMLSNIGAAFIEPLKETYFFKVAKKYEIEEYFGIYNTANPLANIFGPLLAALFFYIGGIDLLWIGTSIILFTYLILSTTIKNKY